MNRKLYILICLCSLLFTSCEDMYHKMIEYTGSEEDPVLCINAEIIAGQQVKVYVTRSWFFLDQSRTTYGRARRGIVSDATVEMQIGDGEWKPLTFVHVNDTVIDGIVQDGKSYYTYSEEFKAGDKVSIRAKHPDYGEAHATETIPMKPSYSVSMGERKNLVIPFTFEVDALTADNNEVIFFFVTGYGHMADTTTYYVSADYGYGTYMRDTFTIAYTWPVVLFPRIYSDDFIFSEYKLPKTDHGLYTQSGPLYTSADHFTEARKVSLLLDCDKVVLTSDYTTDTLHVDPEKYRQTTHRTVFLDSVVIDVRLANESYYWYRTTLFANRSISSSAPEISLYSNDTGEMGYGDIFEEISAIFSELGAQEGTQIYSNIEGGFGHFCFLNHTSVTIPYHIKISE